MIMLYELIVIVFCSSSLHVLEDTLGMTDSSDSYIRTDKDNVVLTDCNRILFQFSAGI